MILWLTFSYCCQKNILSPDDEVFGRAFRFIIHPDLMPDLGWIMTDSVDNTQKKQNKDKLKKFAH